MRPLLYLLICTGLTFASCEEEVAPVNVDLKVFMQGPMSEVSGETLPAEFADLLRPLRCGDNLQYLDVSLTIVRLDHDPIVSENIEVPLTWLNGWRKSSDTYTYTNQLENYEGNATAIPFSEVLALEPGGATSSPDIPGGEILYCCGSLPSGAAGSAKEVSFAELPEYLANLSCEGTLKDRYTINYLLSQERPGTTTPFPVPPSTPAAAAFHQPSMRARVTMALNDTGNPDAAPSKRFTKIAAYEALFTEDAHVKVYGDNGTIVANQSISDYLEMISNYRTIDTIHVDKAALLKDSLCWEVHIREIHL